MRRGAAVGGRGRIPEAVLLAVDAAGGRPGAVVAQRTWRHKTVKRSHRVRFRACAIGNVAACAAGMAIRG